ncbi:MAG: CHAT domain-containing protein, partial [Chloroflexi bacterium]|nr:CHAT domain-containing protein [Chloroflexota bacterium]
MAELTLTRRDDLLTVSLGEHSASVPWTPIAPRRETPAAIFADAVGYGRMLFDHVFAAPDLRRAMLDMRKGTRLVLSAADPDVAQVAWEYLRDPQGGLLAGRLNLVRGLPADQRCAWRAPSGALSIIAAAEDPVDEETALDTEGEWQRVVGAVSKAGRQVRLIRVRPPTLDRLGRSLPGAGLSIVHFMGHSAARDGRALLLFEDGRGRKRLVAAPDFANALDERVFLVILNSCLSSAGGEATTFGNIARGLAAAGVPYALGMQFVLPDAAAKELSEALYDLLLQGRPAEEAMRYLRASLADIPDLGPWLAGLPVLYTSLAEPAAGLALPPGKPTIDPDPARLQAAYQVNALTRAPYFAGRGAEIGTVLDALLDGRDGRFVILHGVGGAGKTALARAVADRVGWRYDDLGLAYSFETFARPDAAGSVVVDEEFAGRFYTRLAQLYGVDTARPEYQSSAALREAILQARAHTRSLLVLDNLETLIDTQRTHAATRDLAGFVARLREGQGAVLITTRSIPPGDWGDAVVVKVLGLGDKEGASLFRNLLPEQRRPDAPPADRLRLSGRVGGHPLSIRLLASRFADTTGSLASFLAHIEAELVAAEQDTPTSLE